MCFLGERLQHGLPTSRRSRSLPPGRNSSSGSTRPPKIWHGGAAQPRRNDMQSILAVPNLTQVANCCPARASVTVVRRSEWIIFAFLLYAPALTFFLPAPNGL